ncbi:hypothetical protein [Psychroserpens sp.]
MEGKYAFGLVVISFFLTNLVAFLDEGIRSFEYLNHAGDWVALAIYTVLFLIIPFLIFFLIKKNLKRRFLFSLFGFTPTILLTVLQLR